MGRAQGGASGATLGPVRLNRAGLLRDSAPWPSATDGVAGRRQLAPVQVSNDIRPADAAANQAVLGTEAAGGDREPDRTLRRDLGRLEVPVRCGGAAPVVSGRDVARDLQADGCAAGGFPPGVEGPEDLALLGRLAWGRRRRDGLGRPGRTDPDAVSAARGRGGGRGGVGALGLYLACRAGVGVVAGGGGGQRGQCAGQH